MEDLIIPNHKDKLNDLIRQLNLDLKNVLTSMNLIGMKK